MGATVLHESAIFPVRKEGIPINIRNTNAPQDKGTMIVETTCNKPDCIITGIAGKKGFVSITIDKDMMNSEIGFGRKVLQVFEDNGISFEHMPSGIDTMTVFVHQDEFVEKELLPDAAETMNALSEAEKTAVSLLLKAYIGFLSEEATVDEQSFPMVKELLSYTQGSKEDGEKDAIDCLMEDTVSRTHRHREYYNNYQRYQLMQVDKERVIMACNIIINDLIGRLYRYDYRFGYDITLASEHSIAKKLSDNWQNEWAVLKSGLPIFKTNRNTNRKF